MRRFITIAASITSMASVAVADTTAGDRDAYIRSLETQVEALRADVDMLKGQSNDTWMTEQRSEEIRSLVYDVLADADTRAAMQDNPMYAGWDTNFFLGDPNGNFLLKIKGQLQIRFVYNHQEDSGGDDDRWSFENRRTKLKFEGHVVDPSWKYHITGAFDREDGGVFFLEDAWIAKEFGGGLEGWRLTAGQFKSPFMREEIVSSSKQLTVDRSLVNEEFNQDRSQGVQLDYEADMWRFAVMYSDGINTDNTAALTMDTEFAFTGRVEYLAGGNWKQFDDFSGFRGTDEMGILIGAAAHYEETEAGTAAGTLERFTWTIDGSLEFDGASIFAAVVGNHLDFDAAGGDLDQYGVVVQGGLFVTDHVELFARYEWGDFDVAAIEELSVVTVGVTRYWDGHNLKWTTDLGYGIDEVNPVWASSGVGWRGDAADEESQVVLRSQLQLLF